MYTFDNITQLEKIVDFFKADKVTETAVALEVAKVLNKMVYPSDVVIEFVDNKHSTTIFLPLILPEFNNQKGTGRILVDRALVNFLTAKEFILALIDSTKKLPSILNRLTEFTISKRNSNVSLDECVSLYIELYYMVHATSNSVISKLRDSNKLSLIDFTELMDKVKSGDMTLQYAIDTMVISGGVPQRVFDEAKELANKLFNEYTVPEEIKVLEVDKPLVNILRNRIRAISNETYDEKKMSKIIPQDYVPKTNQ